MERDFRYLRDQHGDAGAREIFEKICTNPMYASLDADAYNIRIKKGNGGVDISDRNYLKPIENYLCKKLKLDFTRSDFMIL